MMRSIVSVCFVLVCLCNCSGTDQRPNANARRAISSLDASGNEAPVAYDRRPDISTFKPVAHFDIDLAEGWSKWRKAIAVSMAQILVMYPEQEIYFVGAGNELFHDAAKLLIRNDKNSKRVHLLNITEEMQAEEVLLKYLAKEGMILALKDPKKKIVLVDIGPYNQNLERLMELFDPKSTGKMERQYIYSSTRSKNSTNLSCFLATVDEHPLDRSLRLSESFVEEFKKLPNFNEADAARQSKALDLMEDLKNSLVVDREFMRYLETYADNWRFLAGMGPQQEGIEDIKDRIHFKVQMVREGDGGVELIFQIRDFINHYNKLHPDTLLNQFEFGIPLERLSLADEDLSDASRMFIQSLEGKIKNHDSRGILQAVTELLDPEVTSVATQLLAQEVSAANEKIIHELIASKNPEFLMYILQDILTRHAEGLGVWPKELLSELIDIAIAGKMTPILNYFAIETLEGPNAKIDHKILHQVLNHAINNNDTILVEMLSRHEYRYLNLEEHRDFLKDLMAAGYVLKVRNVLLNLVQKIYQSPSSKNLQKEFLLLARNASRLQDSKLIAELQARWPAWREGPLWEEIQKILSLSYHSIRYKEIVELEYKMGEKAPGQEILPPPASKAGCLSELLSSIFSENKI